jgi:hypothetical protein
MDGGAVFIYLGIAFLIMVSPFAGNIATRVLLAIFWPLALVGVVLSFFLKLITGNY